MMEKQTLLEDYGLVQWIIREKKIRNGSLYCLDNKLILHKVDTKYYTTNGPAFINANTFLPYR